MQSELFSFLMGCVVLIPLIIPILFWRKRLWRISAMRKASRAETLEELTESLRPLLQKMSPKVFINYDGYFRESMYEDSEGLYDFFHEHFIPFQTKQVDMLLSHGYFGNMHMMAFLTSMPIVILIILLSAHPASYLNRVLFLLPLAAVYVFFIVFLRKRRKLFQEEIEALKILDDQFAALLSRKLYPDNPAGLATI